MSERSDLPPPWIEPGEPTRLPPPNGGAAHPDAAPGPPVPPTAQPAGPGVPPQDVPAVAADDVDPPAAPLELRPLRPVAWLRLSYVFLLLAGFVLGFGRPIVLIPICSVAMLALLGWTYVAVDNAHRAKPPTAYGSAPDPIAAVAWWFGPIGVALAVGVVALAFRRAEESTTSPGIEFGFVPLLVGIVALVVAVLAFIQPYRCLAHAARWVGGNGDRFLWWFWAPILSLPVAFTIAMFGTGILNESEYGSTYEGVGIGVIIAANLLPFAVQLIQGLRAMLELEQATSLTHEHHGGVPDVDPQMLVERIRAAAAYQARHSGTAPTADDG